MPLFFVRHGETDYNKTFKIQGLMDNLLNDFGREQALDVSNRLKNVDADIIISSTLARASETADIINHKQQVEHVYNDLVIERDFGELEGADARAYYDIVDFSVYKAYEQDEDIRKRAIAFLNTLDDRTYIIVSHSHFIKTIISLYDENFTYKSALPNCAIVKIEDGSYEIF